MSHRFRLDAVLLIGCTTKLALFNSFIVPFDSSFCFRGYVCFVLLVVLAASPVREQPSEITCRAREPQLRAAVPIRG